MNSLKKMALLTGIAAALGGKFMELPDNDYHTRRAVKIRKRGSTLSRTAAKKRKKRNRIASASRRINRK